MPTGFGLRPGTKAPDEPPSPTGYAPPLDSTLGHASSVLRCSARISLSASSDIWCARALGPP